MIEIFCRFESYRGFRYQLIEIESEKAYTFQIYRKSSSGQWLKLLGESSEFPAQEIAERVAKAAIDVVIDSLN